MLTGGNNGGINNNSRNNAHIPEQPSQLMGIPGSEPVNPQYVNLFSIIMNKQGINEGETTIEFRQAYKRSTIDTSLTPTDSNGVANKLVAYLVMSRSSAIALRDALDSVITQSELS